MVGSSDMGDASSVGQQLPDHYVGVAGQGLGVEGYFDELVGTVPVTYDLSAYSDIVLPGCWAHYALLEPVDHYIPESHLPAGPVLHLQLRPNQTLMSYLQSLEAHSRLDDLCTDPHLHVVGIPGHPHARYLAATEEIIQVEQLRQPRMGATGQQVDELLDVLAAELVIGVARKHDPYFGQVVAVPGWVGDGEHSFDGLLQSEIDFAAILLDECADLAVAERRPGYWVVQCPVLYGHLA